MPFGQVGLKFFLPWASLTLLYFYFVGRQLACPCKIRSRILAGSCTDHVGNPHGILVKFSLLGFFILSANPGRILARFSLGQKQNSQWPKSRQDPAANLGKILARKEKSRGPKRRQDPTSNLAKIFAEKQILGGQNLGGILQGVSPRGAVGREILGDSLWESWQNFGHAATNFFWSHCPLNKG